MSDGLPNSQPSSEFENAEVRCRSKLVNPRPLLLVSVMFTSAALSFFSFHDLDIAAVPRLLLFTSSTAIATVTAARALKGSPWTIAGGVTVMAYIAVLMSLLFLWLFVW
jgi:hypothetical protein